MKIQILTPLLALALFCCKKQEQISTIAVPDRLPHVSAEMEAILMKDFPGAMAGPEFADSIIRYLGKKYGVTPNKMLMGASTCVDDIIFTKNFHQHPEIKGPFHLGGLGGLPFTGSSGLEAFAHHIPDSGTMVLIVEPHIGYSEKSGWGYVLRHGQHEASTCCGALMGTLGKLQKGTLKGDITESNYQGAKIAQMALAHKQEILDAKNPIIQLTKLTSVSAEMQIRQHVLDVDLSHMKYIVILTGVLIGTDYQFTDYQFVDHILIYDVQKKQFVEELKNPMVAR